MSASFVRLKANVQYFLPKTLLSRAAGFISEKELGAVTTFLVKSFAKYYHITLDETEIGDFSDFKTFNAFFTRKLKKGARPIVRKKDELAQPADGVVSEFGEIYKDAVIQAKGHYYSLQALLGGNEEDSRYFENGTFATTYLSPSDYHRVHMPVNAKLLKMVFVPGELFSVNLLTAANVDNLFTRNERVVCFFENEELGRFAVVLVGAMIVASITTVFAGKVAPAATRKITVYDYEKDNIYLKKGEELGYFSLGSTVISVFAKDKILFDPALLKGAQIKMGACFARLKAK